MAKLTVAQVERKEKICTVEFVGQEGRKVKFFPKDSFADKIVEGYEGDFTFRAVEGKAKDDGSKWPDEKFVATVDGSQAQAKSFGGGGGYKATPKTPAEIYGPNITGIAKSCIENQKTVQDFNEWVEAFAKALDKFR